MTFFSRARGALERWAMRAAFGVLRRHRPILLFRGKAVVSRRADVLAVLRSDDVFGVTEIYVARMERTTGMLFLGMERSPQYEAEAAACRRALPKDLASRVRVEVSQHTQALIDAARPQGRIEVVNGLFRPVALGMVDRIFGVPGPDVETMKRWLRLVFWDVFLNPGNDPKVIQAASEAGRALSAYLERLISEQKSSRRDPDSDDFLGRMLQLQAEGAIALDDLGVRRNVAGIIVAVVDTLSKAMTQSLDELLRRPRALGEAQAAALAKDTDRLAGYIFEALRFYPHNPVILRNAHQDVVVAQGTARQTRIPRGTLVIAGTQSAMFDEAAVEAPQAFRPNRPPEQYLHFGYGLHTCFGESIARWVLPEVMARLLCEKGLRRAPGADGVLQHEGPFPDRLVVQLGPG